MKNWYEKTAQQALDELSVSAQGLTVEEAARRLEQHGENKLTEGRKKSALQVFAEQFKDLLVIILVAAALISLASGQSESTLVIFAVLLLNAVLGTVQYLKAEKSLESLKAMSAPPPRCCGAARRWPCPRPRWCPATWCCWRPATWWWPTAGF